MVHGIKILLGNSLLWTEDEKGKPMPKLHVEPKYCKGCGICIEFCPAKILKKSAQMNSRGYFPPESDEMEKCKKCGMCTLLCPDFAIAVEE
jgi:2-oxoglutarate ferredoxin oxidoreductase subunit delta